MAYTYSDLTKNIYKPGEVAKISGKSLSTIQKWDNQGFIKMDRTATGQRFMTRDNLIKFLKNENLFYELENNRKDIIYVRISSIDEDSNDFNKQISSIVEKNNDLIRPEIIKEIGSGLNDNRIKLNNLINMILNDEINRIFVTHKDILAENGFNYIEMMSNHHGTKIIILKNNN